MLAQDLLTVSLYAAVMTWHPWLYMWHSHKL